MSCYNSVEKFFILAFENGGAEKPGSVSSGFLFAFELYCADCCVLSAGAAEAGVSCAGCCAAHIDIGIRIYTDIHTRIFTALISFTVNAGSSAASTGSA